MGSLKDDWKETGKDLGGAFKQLGKSIVKSGAVVVNKANDWAERDDAKEAARKEAECPVLRLFAWFDLNYCTRSIMILPRFIFLCNISLPLFVYKGKGTILKKPKGDRHMKTPMATWKKIYIFLTVTIILAFNILAAVYAVRAEMPSYKRRNDPHYVEAVDVEINRVMGFEENKADEIKQALPEGLAVGVYIESVCILMIAVDVLNACDLIHGVQIVDEDYVIRLYVKLVSFVIEPCL